jgi:hypothetical protein
MNESLSRQRDYRELLDRKVKQLTMKRSTFEHELELAMQNRAYKVESRNGGARLRATPLVQPPLLQAPLLQAPLVQEAELLKESIELTWDSLSLGSQTNYSAIRGPRGDERDELQLN